MAREWDSDAYHRLSDPQYAWGLTVIERLKTLGLRGGEHILDAGCGTGRVTAELLKSFPGCRVTAVDASENMVADAAEHLVAFGDRATVRQLDLLELHEAGAFDLVFSTAVFHWIKDHDRLFANIFRALRAGGWLVAQCGGGPNLQRLRSRAQELTESAGFERYFKDWQRVWEYPDASTTAGRLARAGFSDVKTWLHEEPTPLHNAAVYHDFLATVTIHPYLERLPEEMRESFLEPLVQQAEQDQPPFSLDYWRLNMVARKVV